MISNSLSVLSDPSKDLRGGTLFSRYEHGSKPIRVVSGGFEVLNADGTPHEVHKTARSLLAALTGHPAGRHWSLDRYFRRDSREPLGVCDNIIDLLALPVGRPTPLLTTTAGISIASGTGLGIDLSKRAHEVRKLLFAGFGRRMHHAGYDPEDVLQEVYKGILVRNEGKCPWDARKSSFGHYVHMVCSCVLSNYHRKQHRTGQMEVLGLQTMGDGPFGMDDVASNSTIPSPPTLAHQDSLLVESADDLADYIQHWSEDAGDLGPLAVRALPLVVSGAPRERMQAILGVSPAVLSKAIAHLRQATLAWRGSLA